MTTTSTLNFLVKNVRTGIAVRSFGSSQDALDFVAAHGGEDGPLGPIGAFLVQTTVKETPLVESNVVPMVKMRRGK